MTSVNVGKQCGTAVHVSRGGTMAGRERIPLTGTGVRTEFARQLRDARDASGLTLRQLAAVSGYSPAALSQAESGRRFPTWDLTAAFVKSCGQEPAEWRQLWSLARQMPGDQPPQATSPQAVSPATSPQVTSTQATSPPPGSHVPRARRPASTRALFINTALGLAIAATTVSSNPAPASDWQAI